MATSQIKDTASITYTPIGGTAITHLLFVPILISPRYAFERTNRRTRWSAWTSDYRIREVYSLANGAEEITGQIRFDDEPQALLDLLDSALYDNVTLTYTVDGSTTYPCKLVDLPGVNDNEIKIFPDTELFGFGRWMVPVRLRRVDGGTFDGLHPDAT